ncbi:MAG: DUF58 domain-containing protein [Desulfobacteraceae bacterium]|nr:DUF58 domain-containing protein [Desulfobacteraceae bacterium]
MTKQSEQKRVLPVKSDTLPLSFNRHRVYILPTIHGYLFLFILFVMLLGSINYNNNLGFLLVFLLGSITLVSMIHTYRNLLGIAILSVSAKSVFAGKTALFNFLLRAGTSRRSSIGIKIDKEKTIFENINEKSDEMIAVKLRARSRGILRPVRTVVWSRYPLGLFRAWTVVSPDVSCVVYPNPVAGPLRFSGQQSGDDFGDNKLQRGADDFSGLKQYQPGDPIGRISWKSLSKGLGVFTKEFSGAGGMSIMLDYNAVNTNDVELKLSRLTDMVIKAHNMNAEYGLLLPGRTIAPDNSERHKHLCLKALAVHGLKESRRKV